MEDNEIYILETSVLYNLLSGKAGFGYPNWWSKKSFKIIKKIIRTRKTVIPLTVLTEIMGQFFQQNIDLKNYDQWYRRRKAVFDQYLMDPLFNSGAMSLFYGSSQSGRIAMVLCQYPLTDNMVEQLSQHYKTSSKKDRRSPKLFDGMDAAIIGDAIGISLQNPGKSCYFVSNDIWMKQGFSFAKKNSGYHRELDNLSFLRIEKAATKVGIRWRADEKAKKSKIKK